MEMAVDRRPSIVVGHSLPTNWMLPLPMGWAGEKSPPDPSEHGFVYLIGRWALGWNTGHWLWEHQWVKSAFVHGLYGVEMPPAI